MKSDSPIHKRRSIRLQGYDYAQEGLYFVTICVKDWKCLFGRVEEGQMMCNAAGQMIEAEWMRIPSRFPAAHLHEYVVMPNHFHAVLEIMHREDGQKHTVGDMLDAYKSITTVAYIHGVKNRDWAPFDKKLWQRNYHEHIIRSAASYEGIAAYILDNPAKWHEDRFYTP